MTSDVFWKQVCDRSLPDFDAVEQAILRAPVAKARPRGVFWAAAALALVLLAAGTAGLLQRGGTAAPTPQTPDPVLPAPVTEEEKPDEGQKTENVPEEPDDVVVFNEMGEDEVSGALRLDMAVALENGQRWDLAQIQTYLGFDPLPEAVPEGLTATFDETSTWVYAEDGKGWVWDQFSFLYDDGLDIYDPLERTLTVTVAGSEIFECGINFSEEDLKPSTISGVEMWLGQRQVDYGPYTDGPDGEKIPAGYYPLMEANFQRDGFFVRVTAENLTEDEFVAVLKDLAE